MKINVLMLNQDDPKKCTAAKLVRFGLAKRITKTSTYTLVLHPFSKKTLLSIIICARQEGPEFFF